MSDIGKPVSGRTSPSMVCELVLVPGCAGVFAVVESQSKISLRDDTVSTCGPSDLQTAYSGEGSHDASPLILLG